MSQGWYTLPEMISLMGSAAYLLPDLHDELEELAISYAPRIPVEEVTALLEKYDTSIEDLTSNDESLFI